MSSYVEKVDTETREVLEYEATQARQNYVDAVAQKKANGEKVNALTVKREAVAKAIEETKTKFGNERYEAAKKEEEQHKTGRVPVAGSKPKSKETPNNLEPVPPAPDDVDNFDTPIDEVSEAMDDFETPDDTDTEEADPEADPFSDDDF